MLNERGLKMVRQSWELEYFRHSQVDIEVEPFLTVTSFSNWIECARSASFLSRNQVAKRMDISPQTYERFEKNEESISLENLKKCAEAMDCELVYAIRPKQRITFGERAWSALKPYLDPRATNIDRALQSIVTVMYDPRFRRKQGWRRNTTDEAREVTKSLKEMRRQTNVISSHPF